MTDVFDALSQKPDAVLFDLDDTLYPYAPSHAAGMDAVLDRCRTKLGLDATTFERAFLAARKSVAERLKHTAASHHRLLYFQQLIEATTGKSDPALSLELDKTYWRRFMATARLFPGVRDTIDELRYAKIPTALVTDLVAQVQLRKLVYFELEHAFDAVVTSEEVGVEKPHPRIFEHALDKLGLAAGARVWMIGENPEKDIRGAREALRATTLQKLHHGVEHSPLADVRLTDFSELAQGIRRMFSTPG